MKSSNTFLTLIFLFVLNYNLGAQGSILRSIFGDTLSTPQREGIIDAISMDDTVSFFIPVIFNSLDMAVEYNVVEAIHALENNIWRRSNFIRLLYLESLLKLNSPNIKSITLAYFDSLENSQSLDSLTIIESKLEANDLLLSVKEYSKSNCIFELINNSEYDESFSHTTAIRQLYTLIIDSASFSALALTTLQKAVTKEKNYEDRDRALSYLIDAVGFKAFPKMKEAFLTEPYYLNRYSIIFDIERKFPNREAKEFLKENLLVEKDDMIRRDICNCLLSEFGCPIDYKFIQDYIKSEKNPEVYDRVSTQLAVHRYSSTIIEKPIVVMIDTLISYTNQCLMLNWIDEKLKEKLIDIINTSKSFLNNADSVQCALKIQVVNQIADFEYHDTLDATNYFITNEAWQFLFGYSEEILEEMKNVAWKQE